VVCMILFVFYQHHASRSFCLCLASFLSFESTVTVILDLDSQFREEKRLARRAVL